MRISCYSAWVLLVSILCTTHLATAEEQPPQPADVSPAPATSNTATTTDTPTLTLPDAEQRREIQEVPLPVAPETTVVGRPPSAFPNQPLPENAVVSPTMTETNKNEVGSSMTVITQEEIARSQKTQVADLLRDVPGVDVVQSGAPGGVTSVFIRGAGSAQTKVLLDGIPISDPSGINRAFDFATLSVDNIERIEVLRGPQSMLYGSDAMGGVINVITKRGEGASQLRADFTGGSYGTAREAISASGGGKTAYYSVGASYLQSDGFSPVPGGQALSREYFGTTSGRFGWTPSSDLNVDYVFRSVNLNTGIPEYDNSYNLIDSTHPFRNNSFVNRVQTRAMTLDGFWEHKIGFSVTDYDRTDAEPGPYDVAHFHGQSRKVDYQANFALADWNTLSVGADYLNEDGREDLNAQATQSDRGVWFQDQVRIADRWFTTAGFRWDDHSLAGSASTYRVTTRYVVPDVETAFHGSIGTGFRAPSLSETTFSYGNPNVRPEKSFGWDLGVEQPFDEGQFTVDGTYFRNDFTDLIQWDPVHWVLDNVGHAMTSGTELTTKWKVSPVTTLGANYTYTFTRDLDTDTQLLRRAPHKVNLSVNRKLCDGRANVSLYGHYVSPRLDTGSVTLDEYWLVNLASTYDITQHVQLMGRIDNLLGERYEEVYGYATAAFSFYGGVGVHW